MGLSTHILDTALGRPAGQVTVRLARQSGEGWVEMSSGQTDADGRCRTLLEGLPFAAGVYRLEFLTAPYFALQGLSSLYPSVPILFTVLDPAQHFHIPLLIAPHGYTTYRGS